MDVVGKKRELKFVSTSVEEGTQCVLRSTTVSQQGVFHWSGLKELSVYTSASTWQRYAVLCDRDFIRNALHLLSILEFIKFFHIYFIFLM